MPTGEMQQMNYNGQYPMMPQTMGQMATSSQNGPKGKKPDTAQDEPAS